MSTTMALPALDNTMGALLIGTIIAASIWGSSVLHTYEYYSDYPNDHIGMKCVVAIVSLLDTSHQIFITHALYIYLIKGFANPLILTKLLWTFLIQLVITACQGLVCQGFFTWRVYVVSQRNRFLAPFIASLVIGNFVVTLYYYARCQSLTSTTQLGELKNIAKLLVFGYSADILITGSLIYMLLRSKTQNAQYVPSSVNHDAIQMNDVRRTNHIINRLVLYSLNTGFLNSIFAILCFVTATVWSDNLIFVGLYAVLCRMYSVSVLATLNSRKRFRSLSGVHRLTSESFSAGTRLQVARPGDMAIQVDYQPHITDDASSEIKQNNKSTHSLELHTLPRVKADDCSV
ncbi:uncharacterized protein EV420DRAFT_1536014 [Desarmillaria tabescens]|uniref:DUF6534 domain-containing protein n=1 Tax=Armillaria tabescens TaxID=1929756 RepID=A0AA39N7C2_ARMTA|nr:uncharacterized protein EV420DRAFT_1536014 [Desarmillaria tabescens]KAK0460278.1 hypothetical protein EV420DRAFT_1536014 [Desarmillaria tabescens]